MSMTSGSPNMRSFAKDRTVADHKLTRDTLRRILRFARPYRGRLAVFVALIAVEAAAGAVTPLLFKTLIDDGITAGNTQVVLTIAAVVAVLAIVTAGPVRRRPLGVVAGGRGPDPRPAHRGLRPRAAHAARVLQPGQDRRAGAAAQR